MYNSSIGVSITPSLNNRPRSIPIGSTSVFKFNQSKLPSSNVIARRNTSSAPSFDILKNNNDPCTDNSNITKIFKGDTNRLKPRTYCKIDKEKNEKVYCEQEGNNMYHHKCKRLKYPYKENKSFFSFFNSSGGKIANKRSNKNKKINNRKTRKTKK
jgi:hypothetical protein